MQLPPRITDLLELALRPVPAGLRIAEPVRHLTDYVWRHWLVWRPAADNRPEHELVVLGNFLRIGLGEGLQETELRIGAAFALLHDTHFIPRVTEARIAEVQRQAQAARAAGRLAESVTLDEQQQQLERKKLDQRQQHMRGGAITAEFVLRTLPETVTVENWFTDVEAEKCVSIIAGHDRWKLGDSHPPTSDWLAVCCLEADALWPLHPLGVQADLERPDDAGRVYPLFAPPAWTKQLATSVHTLRRYRANWPGDEQAAFQDGHSIFRTPSGFALYREWLDFWGIK